MIKFLRKHPSVNIPLRLAIILIVTGIIAFIHISRTSGTIPTSYIIIWIVVSIILVGITTWSWLRAKKNNQTS